MLRVILAISVLLNLSLIAVILFNRARTQPPPFEPFHIKDDFTDSDLIADGYTDVPVDVYMLGKTIGNLTMHYQLEEESGRSYWREARIGTRMKELDTLGIYKLIESYEADILLPAGIKYNKTRYVPPLASPFLVKHRTNNQIFECRLERAYVYDSGYHFTGYDISVVYESPLIDSVAINLQRKGYSYERFGPDTTILEDGSINIEYFWDGTREGEDIVIRPNGMIASISNHSDDELQHTINFYENGALESDVLTYNQTGFSCWWYQNGCLKEEVEYNEGRRRGRHVTYYQNCRIKTSGQYIDGFYDTGIKEGEWKYYDSSGRIKMREFYKSDTLVRVIK